MRFYQIENNELPSVTSIIGEMWPKKQLNDWKVRVGAKEAERISRETSSFGTACHKIIATYLSKNGQGELELGIGASDKIKFALERWKKWWKFQGLTPVAVERTVWDDKVAGTLDLLAVDSRGRLVLVDWKFGKGIYPSYFLQMGEYYHLVRQHQKEKAFRGMIVRVHPDPQKKGDEKPLVKRFTESQLRKHGWAFNHLYEMWLWKCQYDKMKPYGVRTRVKARPQGQERHQTRRLFKTPEDSSGN